MPILYSQNAARHVTFCVHICGEKSPITAVFTSNERAVSAYVLLCRKLFGVSLAHGDAVHCVGALERAGGHVSARRVGTQLRRFLSPPGVRYSELLAPPVLLASAGGVPLRSKKDSLGAQYSCRPHYRYRPFPPTDRVERCLSVTALLSESFFERGPGVSQRKTGSQEG